MRAYIANITTNLDRQVEKDPALEELRQARIRSFKIGLAEREAKKHLDEISGRRDIRQIALDLFDSQGNPPANVTTEDIEKQYKKMIGQYRWMKAILQELHKKMNALDPALYAQETGERGARKKEREDELDRLEIDRAKDRAQVSSSGLRNAIRDVLRQQRRANVIRQFVKKHVKDARITGVRQIETALRYLFAEYATSPAYAVTDDAPARYAVMRREADWLDVAMAELEVKLASLGELREAYQLVFERNA